MHHVYGWFCEAMIPISTSMEHRIPITVAFRTRKPFVPSSDSTPAKCLVLIRSQTFLFRKGYLRWPSDMHRYGQHIHEDDRNCFVHHLQLRFLESIIFVQDVRTPNIELCVQQLYRKHSFNGHVFSRSFRILICVIFSHGNTKEIVFIMDLW